MYHTKARCHWEKLLIWTVWRAVYGNSVLPAQFSCKSKTTLKTKPVNLYKHSSECGVTQSCLTHCNPRDCRLPCSSVHGIISKGILEWVAISSSRRSSQFRDWTWVSCSFCIIKRILYHWAKHSRIYTLKTYYNVPSENYYNFFL